MQEEKQLSIGLFEENSGRLVILYLFLTQAGYAVSVCCEGGKREASELRRGLGKEIAGRVCLWKATI